MVDVIVAQNEEQVKLELEYIFGDPPGDECSYDDCAETVFHDSGLCFDHFIEEEDRLWDDQWAERETCLAGMGYR